MAMNMDVPPPSSTPDVPVLEKSRGGAPVNVRYSDFLKLVNADRVEKVTFSADGTKLLGVDTDGARIKIESLPNDPGLLNELTSHKVDVTVLPNTPEASGLGDLAQSLIFPAILFAGLFFFHEDLLKEVPQVAEVLVDKWDLENPRLKFRWSQTQVLILKMSPAVMEQNWN